MNNQKVLCACGCKTLIAQYSYGRIRRFVWGHNRHINFDIRFWDKVAKSKHGCWEWLGAKNKHGYGCIGTGSKGNIRAHRAAWELSYGLVPKGLCVLHKCDNPSCVRPDHLFIGSQLDNLFDCSTKGRRSGPKGTQNHNAKLTEKQIKLIRKLHDDFGLSYRKIARKFNILSHNTIRAIVLKKSWKHV